MTDRNIMCPLESLLLKYDTPSIFKAKSHLEMSINLVLAFLSKFCEGIKITKELDYRPINRLN